MAPHAVDLFDEWFSPLKVSFWHVPEHHTALIGACDSDGSADEMVALGFEWSLVAAGERGTLGEPCLCHRRDVWPSAVPGGRKRGDTRSALVGLVADLDRAADALPDAWLHWPAVHRVYWVQRRARAYFRRVGARQQPPEPEPHAENGRSVARQQVWEAMARTLGWEPNPLRRRISDAISAALDALPTRPRLYVVEGGAVDEELRPVA